MTTKKPCGRCRKVKPLSEFTGVTKKAYYCRPCAHAVNRSLTDQYRAANESLSDEERQVRDRQLKTCPGCKQTKQRKEFGQNRSRKDGIAAYCRVCLRNLTRKRRQRERQQGN